MITNFKCTIYHFNGVGYSKFYVPHCHWQENKASNVVKSGLQNADSVTIYIPLESFSYNTIMSIDIKDYGAKRLQHIKISGK